MGFGEIEKTRMTVGVGMDLQLGKTLGAARPEWVRVGGCCPVWSWSCWSHKPPVEWTTTDLVKARSLSLVMDLRAERSFAVPDR